MVLPTYGKGKILVEALKDVDLTIRDNEYVAIVGPSGSGKSTLMNILGFLDTPTGGAYRLRGERPAACLLCELARAKARAGAIPSISRLLDVPGAFVEPSRSVRLVSRDDAAPLRSVRDDPGQFRLPFRSVLDVRGDFREAFRSVLDDSGDLPESFRSLRHDFRKLPESSRSLRDAS